MDNEQSLGGPFVQVACVCQTALQENTGTISIIRVTDRVQVVGINPEMQPQPLQNYMLAIILKAGGLRETHQVRIAPVLPSGQKLPEAQLNVLFEGDERGVQIITPLAMIATETGLHWIEVYLEQMLLTRIPLRVLYNRAQIPPGMKPPTG